MAIKQLQIDVYSHNVKVTNFTPQVRKLLNEFTLTLAEFELVKVSKFRFEKKITKVYAARTSDKEEYRFHINCLIDLLVFLKFNGYDEETIDINTHIAKPGKKVKFNFIDKRIPREEQVPLIEYLVTDSPIKALTLQTGKGKSLLANHALNVMAEREIIIIKGMYVDRWLDDLQQTFKLEKGDLLIVRGSRDLINLIDLALNNQLEAKIIIITNTTFRNYITEYELNPQVNMYGCAPENFFPLMEAGIRLIDEVHQDFHLNFRIDLYTHIKTCINLSATLLSDNKTLNKMYLTAYPMKYRTDTGEYDKYIDVKAYLYQHREIRQIRYKQRGAYSHVTYEESIMKNPKLYRNYIAMVIDIVRKDFVADFEYGQKLLIFCATVEMCTRLTEELKRSDLKVIVGRKVAEDSSDVLEDADIIVSTLKSTGTAVDIDGLKKVLMLVAIGSRQANEQAVGRLRKMRNWPNCTPEFIYMVAEDIDKHITYHRHKRDVLSDKILSLKEFITPYRI